MSKYPIQVVSKLSGIGVHTLRAWEKRYHLVNPKRNESGRRLYSDEDVEKLRLLSDLCSLGNNIGSMADKSIADLQALLKKLGKKEGLDSAIMEEVREVDIQASLKSLMMALEFYKLDVISHEIKKIILTLTPKDFVYKILIPLLQDVGLRVDRGDFSIAQEHALSSILKFHIGHMIYQSYQQRKKKQSLIVLTTPEGELHEFGVLMASLLCCHYGVNFYYLGPSLPVDALFDAMKSLEADVAILGTTIVTGKSNNLDSYITKAMKRMGKNMSLWIGGAGEFDLEQFIRNKKFKYIPSLNYLENLIQQLD